MGAGKDERRGMLLHCWVGVKIGIVIVKGNY